MHLTFSELLAYATEEQNRWRLWFETHGDAPLRFALAGDRMPTLGSLIQHAFGTELWFAEHLGRTEITEWWKQPCDTSALLFELGASAKRKLDVLIGNATEAEWGRVEELREGERAVRLTLRKAVANALLHEIRHWAQVAVIVRMNGLAPPGNHDLILSEALE